MQKIWKLGCDGQINFFYLWLLFSVSVCFEVVLLLLATFLIDLALQDGGLVI